MRISHSLTYRAPRPTVVALGFFDGVHLGHQTVIREARLRATELSCDCAVFTFSQSPREILSPGSVSMISSQEDREEALCRMGVDRMVSVPFDDRVRSLSPTAFFQKILRRQLRAQHLVCGFNYSFGAHGSGNVTLLADLCGQAGIGLTVLPDVTVQGRSVSSSAIRHAVRDGRMEEAAALLGRPFSLRLPVVDGQKLARRLGFPTMNQRIPDGFLMPRHGVYVTRATLPGESTPTYGITNLGIRPTVGGGDAFAETHLFDFEGDLYGKQIQIELLTFLRPERKFETVTSLSDQVHSDILAARDYLRLHGVEKKKEDEP